MTFRTCTLTLNESPPDASLIVEKSPVITLAAMAALPLGGGAEAR